MLSRLSHPGAPPVDVLGTLLVLYGFRAGKRGECTVRRLLRGSTKEVMVTWSKRAGAERERRTGIPDVLGTE